MESVIEELPFAVAGTVAVTRAIVELELRPLERSLAWKPHQYE